MEVARSIDRALVNLTFAQSINYTATESLFKVSIRMLDRAVLESNEGEYENKRNQQKLSVSSMFIVFIKSTIGLAIFGYHEVYQKSGVYAGLIISAIYIITVVHGCMRMVTFADELEASGRFKNYHTDTYFELVEMMFDEKYPKLARSMGPVTFFISFLSTVCFTISITLALVE